ncbi:MAG: hypothetical protein WBO55_01290 [Rhizobiaceae bacterium]
MNGKSAGHDDFMAPNLQNDGDSPDENLAAFIQASYIPANAIAHRAVAQFHKERLRECLR